MLAPGRRTMGRRTAATIAVLMTASFVFVGSTSAFGGSRGTTPRQVAYFIQWGIYGGFFAKNVDTSGAASRLTHINYAFGNVAPEGNDITCQSGDAWADYQRPASADESVDGVADQWGE